MKVHMLATCTKRNPWHAIEVEEIERTLGKNIRLVPCDWYPYKRSPGNHDFLLTEERDGVIQALARNIAAEFQCKTEPCVYITELSQANEPKLFSKGNVRTLPAAIRGLSNAIERIYTKPTISLQFISLKESVHGKKKYKDTLQWLRRRKLNVCDNSSRLLIPSEGSKIEKELHLIEAEEKAAAHIAHHLLKKGFREKSEGDAYAMALRALTSMRELGLEVELKDWPGKIDELNAFTIGASLGMRKKYA